nr:exo-alpha-sialidase [Terriglobales bacterium]
AATIAVPSTHANSGGLRDLNLSSAAMDVNGKAYVAWHDCRFRAGCSSNDIVVSTSMNGETWSTPHRVPIDPISSTVDHFLPGLEIEPGTGGPTAHIALTYYFYPQANCTASTCQLMEGYVSSPDAGNTWTAPVILAGPIKLGWIADTDQGFMVGDYQSVSFVNGQAYPSFASATANTGMFHEDMFSTASGLIDGLAINSSHGEQPVQGFHSDHLPLTTPAWVE